MDIVDIVREDVCTLQLTAKSKNDCLMQLAFLMSNAFENLTAAELFEALKEREQLGSTGFENGIAIPHAKLSRIDRFALGIAVAPKGIEFGSIDGKKSSLFFTIIGPDTQAEEHLKLLATVSRISRNQNARKELMGAISLTALKETFIRFSWSPVPTEKKPSKQKLLIIVLYEKRYFEDIINLLLEKGIHGANIFDSTGIRDVLSNIPLFSSFLNFLGERSDVSKTILTIIGENQIGEIVAGLEEIIGNLDHQRGAAVMAIDLFYLKGSLES